jgi:rhodanese-related sulfurtransferase
MKEHFFNFGMEINGILHLSPKEAFEAIHKDCCIIDIRRDFEIAGKKISGTEVIYIPYSLLSEKYHELGKDKKYIIVDAVGMRSKDAVAFLIEKGFAKVANLNGGIVDWEKDKLPMNIDKEEMLTGSCLCQLRPKKRFNKKKE